MNVIITGASAGIGYQLVRECLRDERVVKVVGIGRRAELLQEHVAYAQRLGCQNKYVPLAKDVLQLTQADLLPHLNRVDVLINNAGLLVNRAFDELTLQDFESVYRTNVFAPAMLIQLLKPFMGGDIASHVVNIGSMGGFQGAAKFPGLSAYSSSKSAVAGLSECLAEEFKDQNIKVNCLALGAVQTEMLAQAFPGFKAPVTAEEMATFIHRFALQGHRFFNGKVLPVSSSTP